MACFGFRRSNGASGVPAVSPGARATSAHWLRVALEELRRETHRVRFVVPLPRVFEWRGDCSIPSMQIPLRVTFRGMKPSPALEERIRYEARSLERFGEELTGCRVTVALPHQHGRKGQLYSVKIALHARGEEIVVDHDHGENHAHEDLYVAVRDAFELAERRVEQHVRRRRGEIKRHDVA